MTFFRTRRFQACDVQEINDLFNSLQYSRGSPPRKLDQMRWLWHQAPGGPADSWVIETRDGTGWRIIGHHALCPVRFTLADQDFLCAKTTNSFLLPEFRDKFLYLRFEQECLREADARFDATYSVASGTSRLRRAFGYENFGTWIQLERGFQPQHLILRAIAGLAGRYSYSARVRLLHAFVSISVVPRRKPSIELIEHTATDAASSKFFTDFWTEARPLAGMAPRRDSGDLGWRFWKNPDFTGSTLTYEWPEGGRAYCIVDTHSNPLIYHLADFFITPANTQRLESLLDALFIWCAQRGALALGFLTTPRGLPDQLLDVFLRKMKPFALQRFVPTMELPRRLSPLGKTRTGGVLPDWNTTKFLVIA